MQREQSGVIGIATANLTPTICVVDDDQAVRAAISNLLEASDYNALLFESGEAFLSSPNLHLIDFAIFDVKLRGMDGFALQEQCIKLGLNMPLLFISGHGDRDMERKALAAGALAFLRKPVDPELLCAYIEDRLKPQQLD
jgi:two-component system response regulator FixJ